MKNIKYGLIALATILAGTGSAYAVSASSEAYTAEAITISAQPLSIEDAAKVTETSHGCHRASCVPFCPRCKFSNSRARVGHCKAQGRLRSCTRSS